MRPFVLLQLSDLHFGPNSRFAGVHMDGLAGQCADAVRDARQQLGWLEDVGLVLITGDIAEAARPGEYDSALLFFGTLVETLGMTRSAVVFVPGNHDVSWTQCQAVEGQLRDELFPATELRDRLDAVKLTRFNDMVARFYDPSLSSRHTGTGPAPARPVTAGDVTALPRGAVVLVDRSDLAVSFAHLSFQEFLAAHFVFANQEGDARIKSVRTHASDLNWWETLRLWAGLTADQSPEKLSVVLTVLRQESRSFWLAGSILADGTGELADFEAWWQEMCGRLIRHEWPAAYQCARAWAASKQLERRTGLTTTLSVLAASAHWLDGIDLADWSNAASLEVAQSPELVEVLAPLANEVAQARSRALAGSSWRWPGHDLRPAGRAAVAAVG